MFDKKILVVYNICGIKFDNLGMWEDHLQDILNQDYPNFTVAVSGCVISENSKIELDLIIKLIEIILINEEENKSNDFLELLDYMVKEQNEDELYKLYTTLVFTP